MSYVSMPNSLDDMYDHQPEDVYEMAGVADTAELPGPVNKPAFFCI